jgi:hypothetical protein
MSDDLVTRLRKNCPCKSDIGCADDLCGEAADRIEQLEAVLFGDMTLRMLLAGKKSLFSCSEDPEFDDARNCFRAMVNAALGEKKDD